MAVVASGGVIHVADPGAGGVHRFDTQGGGYSWITGPKGRPLPSPVGLARGANGEVYLTDSALAGVYVIRPGAKEAEPLALRAALKQPTGIAFDATGGKLYVTDTAAHCILVFSRSGELLSRIGQRGTGEGEFNFPTYITLTRSGRLYVNDSLNFRLQAFDAQGKFVNAFGRQGDGAGDAMRQKGVAIDRYGHIYVVDALLHALQIFDDAGRLLLPVGERGQQPGEFWLPTGIFIDPDDRDTIYIADSFNQRVQVLRYVGGAD
jgi:sugar lactone lactonase YvrE